MSDDDLLDLEFEKMTMGKTITMEELERRRAAALLREREERKEFKESRRGFAGEILSYYLILSYFRLFTEIIPVGIFLIVPSEEESQLETGGSH